ncbi:hypothetical protein K1X84_15490 [bacterium]|nr:hypothetical protein [bacterium]
MIDQLIAIIIDEGKWLFFSMVTAFMVTLTFLYRYRDSDIEKRVQIMMAMNLFFGLMIGVMAFGHLLAVTTKHIVGILEGSRLRFYAIGIALALPSWSLIYHARSLIVANINGNRKTLILNTWVVLTLAVLGLHNFPLAVTGLLNIGYQLHSRQHVGWAIVTLAILINIALFVGSMIFFASGQSFEQFQGME